MITEQSNPITLKQIKVRNLMSHTLINHRKKENVKENDHHSVNHQILLTLYINTSIILFSAYIFITITSNNYIQYI